MTVADGVPNHYLIINCHITTQAPNLYPNWGKTMWHECGEVSEVLDYEAPPIADLRNTPIVNSEGVCVGNTNEYKTIVALANEADIVRVNGHWTFPVVDQVNIVSLDGSRPIYQ